MQAGVLTLSSRLHFTLSYPFSEIDKIVHSFDLIHELWTTDQLIIY